MHQEIKGKMSVRRTAENIRCKLCCVFISCSRVNPRRFLISAQRSCPEDSVDRTQHTLSCLCWKSSARVPFALKDRMGLRPVPFRWVMTIRSGPPMRSTARLSPGSGVGNMEELFSFFVSKGHFLLHQETNKTSVNRGEIISKYRLQ